MAEASLHTELVLLSSRAALRVHAPYICLIKTNSPNLDLSFALCTAWHAAWPKRYVYIRSTPSTLEFLPRFIKRLIDVKDDQRAFNLVLKYVLAAPS